jgi:hypothetical protein
MRRLAAYAFLCSCLIRPSGFLCIEPTGDVRVEYGTSACCVNPGPTGSAGITGEAAGGCDGCLDVAISTPSLSSNRLHLDAKPAFSAAAGVAGWARGHRGLAVDPGRSTTSLPPGPRLLSTTIIRC